VLLRPDRFLDEVERLSDHERFQKMSDCHKNGQNWSKMVNIGQKWSKLIIIGLIVCF
jgi:hypothetical protein